MPLPAKEKNAPSEKQIQKALFQWIDYKAKINPLYHSIYAIPNGAHLAAGFLTWRSLADTGAKPGVPDVCIPMPNQQITFRGHALYGELKTTKGKLSEKQLEWIARLKHNGNCAEVWRSFDEAKNAIERWIELVPPQV